MKYLFICDGGKNRSPAAVRISRDLAKQYEISNYEADSSGVSIVAEHPNVLDKYDRVFVMSGQLETQVLGLVPKPPIVNLRIIDDSNREANLRRALEPHFIRLAKQDEARQS